MPLAAAGRLAHRPSGPIAVRRLPRCPWPAQKQCRCALARRQYRRINAPLSQPQAQRRARTGGGSGVRSRARNSALRCLPAVRAARPRRQEARQERCAPNRANARPLAAPAAASVRSIEAALLEPPFCLIFWTVLRGVFATPMRRMLPSQTSTAF